MLKMVVTNAPVNIDFCLEAGFEPEPCVCLYLVMSFGFGFYHGIQSDSSPQKTRIESSESQLQVMG